MTAHSSHPSFVVTALGMTSWEPEFITALRHPSIGINVQRRCFEVVDLLAFLHTTTVDGVLVGQDLEGLDAELIVRIQATGAWVVVLALDEAFAQWAVANGADAVVLVDCHHPVAAARETAEQVQFVAQPHDPLDEPLTGTGRLVCVWGPPGSPGRSTVALALADECAREGLSTALVDADRYAPSLDQLLGMAAVPASVTWAQRQAAQGMLTRLALLDAMPMTRTGVRLLPGAAGGSMLRPHLWPQVLRELRSAVQVVVVDLGAQPCADWVTGDDLYVDAAFECDELVTVGTCDPVGLARLMRFLECVKATATHFQATGPKHTVTVTHVPAGNHVATAFLRTHVASCVESLGGNLALVDDDPQTCLKSRTKGQTLAECAPTSQIRRDLRALASHICGRAA